MVSLLRQDALRLQNSNGAVPPCSIVGHASSGQFLGSLLSEAHHIAQLLRVAVADVRVAVLVLFHFDNLPQCHWGHLESQCKGYKIAQST